MSLQQELLATILILFFLLGFVLYIVLILFHRFLNRNKNLSDFKQLVNTIYIEKTIISIVFSLCFGVAFTILFFLDSLHEIAPILWFAGNLYPLLLILERKTLIKMSKEFNISDMENMMKQSRQSNVSLIEDNAVQFLNRRITFLERAALQRWYEKIK